MEISHDNLRSLISRLPGFNSDYTKPIYNPMEEFVSYVVTKEIIHSKIIASLLNPAGGHGCGMLFLLKFLETIGITVPENKPCLTSTTTEPDISDMEIFTEYTIEDKRRIDILLTAKISGKKCVVVIENKLNDAHYQENQLEDYRNAYKNDKPLVVSIHRVEKGDEPRGADKVLYADDMARIIDSVILGKDNPNMWNLHAYSSYLKNLSKQNIIMDNAERLLNLSPEDVQYVRTLSEAYAQLPRAYAIRLKKTALESNFAEETSVPNKYGEEYCYIWNKSDYGNDKPFWVAVGFSQDTAYFYIVSDDKHNWTVEQKDKFAESIGFKYSSDDNSGRWYKACDPSQFAIQLIDPKSYWDQLITQIGKVLERIHYAQI